MLIREAIIQDAVFIKRLLVQLGYSGLDVSGVEQKIEAYRKDNFHLLVAEADNEVIGFISLHWFPVFHSSGNIGRITAFCVDEHFRSQGTGKLMLDAAEVFFKKQNCVKIEVTSNMRRVRSHEFYLKHGYMEESKRFSKVLD